MADPFTVLVANLNQLGFFGFLLPFIFVFVVVFAVLLKTKALGDNTRIMGVLALVVAFFSIGFGGPAMAAFFTTLFGWAAIVIAGILVVVLFFGMTGADIGSIWNKGTAAVLVAIAVIIFFIAMGSMGVRVNDSVFQIVFIIIILAVAVAFVTQGTGK